METHRRGADGRRLFNAPFKQEQLARIAQGELTLPELARELGISPSVVRRWQQLSTNGSTAAVRADEEVVPASELRAAQQRIKDLERALGKKVRRADHHRNHARASAEGTMTGPELRAILRRLQISQDEAARRLDIDRSTMWRYIHGQLEIPGIVAECARCWEALS